MILVVALHTYVLCFMDGNVKDYELSYNIFFGFFRMPLFYFISGFVFFKDNRDWNSTTLKQFIFSKVRIQLLSTFVFFTLFCWLFQKDIKSSIFNSEKEAYWFTYVLFIFFILYIGIDIITCRLSKKKSFNNFTIITSFVVGILLYYSKNNGSLLNILPPQMTTLLSISKWEYFLFFSFGCFIHKYYVYFLRMQNLKYVKGLALFIFVCASICLFYQNINNFIYIHNYILKLITALFGIMLVMLLFKDNECHLSNSTKLGNCLQYIGKRTLDIYLLHYFFLPYNMSFVGNWLKIYPNPLLEFILSSSIALIVIVCCLLISKIIRLSPMLTYLLLGGKKSL